MEIDITAISLDIENFRHDRVTSEAEAIQAMLSDETNHKIMELASDIIDMSGLDPSSRLIVMEDINNKGQYIALEGNRRVTALKTLINPDLAQGMSMHRRFQSLSSKFLKLDIKKVDCVVLDRQEASAWIKRKHYIGMGGRGVVPWNAVATARSDAHEGVYRHWMIALDFIAENGISTEGLLKGIQNKTTTVDRVLGSSHFETILGISFDLKNAALNVQNRDALQAATLLKNMIADMSRKEFTVSVVDNSNMQRDYISKFEDLSVRLSANQNRSLKSKPANKKTEKLESIMAPDVLSSGNGSSAQYSLTGNDFSASVVVDGVKPNTEVNRTKRSKPLSERKVLADKGLRINNYTLNSLYHELRKIRVETNPHICAAMLRIFLEKSTMVFLVDMDVDCLNPNGWHDTKVRLRDKVKAVLNEIDVDKLNTKLKYAWEIANNVQDRVHTLDHLNSAIHDHALLPAPSELITAWDRIHPYFESIFEALDINGK